MSTQPKLAPLLGGQVRSIPAFYEGQNANGSPDHYVSRAEASTLKSRGLARSIHRGTAVLIKGSRIAQMHHFEKRSRGWRVLDQTPPGGPPGRPHWGTVK